MLAAGRSRIDAALADLRQARNIQLFVLFVETTGNRTVTDYADEVARRSSLGGNDALLVVAVGDRSDALWRGGQLRDALTDRELEAILSNRVEPLLAQGDFPGAVGACANGLAEAVAGTASGNGAAWRCRSGAGTVAAAPGVLVSAGGLWPGVGPRSAGASAPPPRRPRSQTEERAQEANELLIRADEAVRDAEEEMAFAEAQFGSAEVVPYREAVARASADLKVGVRPASAAGRRRARVARGAPTARRADTGARPRAQTALDEQRQRIEQLRDVERRAPEILAALPGSA